MRRTTTMRFALAMLFLVAGPMAWQTGPQRAHAADDAETFQQLLDEEQDRPRVFGPEDDDLVHSSEGLVVAPATETLSLRDLAVHVTFINPYDASTHSWDYGIGFRVNDNSFYWVGVIAGGLDEGPAWLHAQGRNEFIDVQPAPDLDQTDGGTNTLDLIAVADQGYLGINGTYVGTLDLSAHQESGGIAIGTSFFDDSFVEGEQTGYVDFTVWSFDETAAPEPTATRTPRARTATPQSLGRTPTTSVVTPSPEDETPPANGVDGTSYTSPTFGYSLTWDETWEIQDAVVANLDDDETTNDEDVLSLSNGVSDVIVSGSQATGTPEECVSSVETLIGQSGGEPEVGVNTDGTPIRESSSSNAYAVYTVTMTDGGEERGVAWYVECRLFDPDVMVKVQQIVDIDNYNDQLEARAALLDSLQLPEAPEPTATRTSRPTPPPTEEPTEVPTKEPAAGETVGLKLTEQDGSGVSGLVTLSPNGDQTDVNALVLGAPTGALLLIHEGTCDALNPAPAFLLRDLDQSGASLTTINVSLEDLRAGGYAIALHAGVNDLSHPLACGEIPGA